MFNFEDKKKGFREEISCGDETIFKVGILREKDIS
jgi:hypothetical protein